MCSESTSRRTGPWFQSLGRDSVGWDLQAGAGGYRERCGFNPSVGILWGGTAAGACELRVVERFQSLGRDSVGWDLPVFPQIYSGYRVSIPRSGFCGVGRKLLNVTKSSKPSFNPSVGILWGGTGRCGRMSMPTAYVSIPRSGFCGVGPLAASGLYRPDFAFQSLGRDSVGWDYRRLCD